ALPGSASVISRTIWAMSAGALKSAPTWTEPAIRRVRTGWNIPPVLYAGPGALQARPSHAIIVPLSTPLLRTPDDEHCDQVRQEGVQDRRQASALQGPRPRPCRAGPQGDPAGRAGDAGPHGAPGEVRQGEASRRRPHHGLPAHDRADRGPHRDPD